MIPSARLFLAKVSTERISDPGLDEKTEMPAFFSARRMQRVGRLNPGMPPEAIASWLLSTQLRVRGNVPGAQQALERAVEIAPAVIGPRLELAVLLGQIDEIEAAITHYRRILELEPKHVVALNNLAFALAVNQNAPAEGLPLARRAVTLAPASATILDTLAWIEHLLGDHHEASKRLAEAIRRDPNDPEFRLHAAAVHAAIGARGPAEVELKEALRLNPALAESDRVRELRVQLATLPQ